MVEEDYAILIREGWKIVYRKEYMIVFEGRIKGYLVWNSRLRFREYIDGIKVTHHTHIRSLKTAKKICENVVKEKIPYNAGKWIRCSHIRCSDGEYLDKLKAYFDRDKKDKYNNKGW